MQYQFYINGETPAKKNNRITLKSGRTIPSKRYQLWHKEAIAQLLAQTRPESSIDEPIVISLCFYHGDKRRRDSDNGTSSILDTLTDAHIIADDSWQIVRGLSIANSYDKDNARVSIKIESLSDYIQSK